MQATECEVCNVCGWYFYMLGRGADTEPIFVNVCLPETFSYRKCIGLFRLLEAYLSVSSCSFFNAEISFSWHSGKTCLELYTVPVTYLYKKRLCKFSVVGIKNVNMSELENVMHFLPISACVFILLVYNRFGLPSVITVWACGANSPLVQHSVLPPFLFSHRIML